MEIERIEAIKSRFHNEWLLIDVEESDEFTAAPITGRLIAHSPGKEGIYQELIKIPESETLTVEYSEDTPPKDYF